MEYKQVYWKDVETGQEIPDLVRYPTPGQLVMWAGAVDDYNPMHQDKEYAIQAGYSGPIVFGPLLFSFMEQMLTDWMGIDGWLKKIKWRHIAPALPNEDVICRGKITDKYVKDGEHCVELEISAEDRKGKILISGSAVVTLPE